MTQVSSTSSSLYPASTSAGSRTESSMPYTDDQDDADVSYPEIVTPEHPNFDPDDVSNRLRLLLNNSYFLPPAHAKPNPFSLSPNPSDPSKKAKPSNGGFLGFFGIGKSKAKSPTSTPGSPPAVDSSGPILRTTSDTPTASGMLLQSQTQPLVMPTTAILPTPPPTSRVVVLRERMDDLATAAKEAEKELRNRTDTRKQQSSVTPRNRFLDDIIDPTDAVDLPPPSADSPFAVQASAVYGLGPMESVNAAVLADRLIPGSPAVWSINSEEESWRKELLMEAVSHSLGNTPDHSFSSSMSGAVLDPVSPPAQSEASFPIPTVKTTQRMKVGQRIVEDFAVAPSPPPVHEDRSSVVDAQFLPIPSTPFVQEPKTPSIATEQALSPAHPPARAETPAHMPLPLAPPPRKQLVNPLYSLSQPDLPEAVAKSEENVAGSSSGSGSYHTVRKATSTPGNLSAGEEVAAQRMVMSLSPPPLPEHPGQRSITPALAGMPSFTTTRTRTESDSRYSSDSVSFRTPVDTDVDHAGGRPSMSYSVPSGRPSVSVSEYSMPSPTASAFRDAVFGSCRPPSTLSRRSVPSLAEPLPEVPTPMPPLSPRSVDHPPPRISTTVPPVDLPLPPRPRATRPLYRPSSSTRSSSSRNRPSTTASENDVHNSSVHFSSNPSSPGAPLSARRGVGSTLSLTIPDRHHAPAIHSAPAPASPVDFFDRLQSTIHNAMDDLETSDESDSEELSLSGAEHARSRFNPRAPGQSPSTLRSVPRSTRSEDAHVETASVFVEPRTMAISNRASSSSARPSIMRLGNHSTPQLSPSSSFFLSHQQQQQQQQGAQRSQESLPQYTHDPKKPIGNVVELPTRRSFSSTRSGPFGKRRNKDKMAAAPLPLLPIGAVPSAPLSPGLPPGRASESAAARPSAGGGGLRPASAGTGAGGRKVQRESILRFDGMLVQHLAAEKDRMKRITNDYASSTTSSPVQPPSGVSGQMPFTAQQD